MSEEYLPGDLEDEGGAKLTDLLAEQQLLGALLRTPDLVADIRELVSPREFYDRVLGRLYEKLVAADGGFFPEDVVEWLGGNEIAGRTDKQAVGYLIATGADVTPDQASVLANEILECAERRFYQEGQTNLVGLDGWHSKMGAMLFAERNSVALDDVDFLVEDLIPERELVIVMGETQAGKSFLTSHLGLAIAQGKEFFGRRILEPRPVIWCCYEGGGGARGRLLAYAKHFGVEAELPFAALTSPFDLWAEGGKNVDELIREIEGICATEFGGRKPGAVIIDTHNAATSGASEIDSEVVSKIRDGYKRICRSLDCSVIIVGHTNALGKHRGNEQLTNNVPTILTVSYKTKLDGREKIQIKDNDSRPVRQLEIVKQREGETGKTFDFVLHGIETGIKNKFGKVRTSCVVTAPNWTPAEQEAAKQASSKGTKDKAKLGPIQIAYFKAFWEALHEFGEAAPPPLNLPRGALVVRTSVVNRTFVTRFTPSDLSADTAKSRRQRAEQYFQNKGIIRINNDLNVVWWTGAYHPELKETHSRRRAENYERAFAEPEPEFPE
ncbi:MULTISPECIES: AAA family ATPase [unclassified Bradyrhizobium]|uniref:AAA family ATPase n=1 Tax=unclassified Bradyrhizobium TaxID=2631580 RepID=UPI0029168416|nr:MULTISPECIES: AAA family ATPase [unclassified Bradyrhizobium]